MLEVNMTAHKLGVTGYGGRARFWAAALVLFGVLALPAAAAATTLISQSFTADSNLPAGSIVSLRSNTTDHVDSATVANANYMLGVTIDSGNSQLTISSGQSNQVEVATSGVEEVLVSDINGKISVGDPVTASPISGVGMKATGNVKVIGLAQDSFPNNTATKESYNPKNGPKQEVKIGEIPVLINVAFYYKQPDKTIIPAAIQNVANALAGKNVSALPIVVSIGIFLVMLVVVMSIIYSMIRSSIISVGRNPMSQAAVYRNVIQLSALVVIIIMAGVGAIYMVLTKF